MAAITIKNMDVTYNKGKSYVIKDMNLEIKDGEFCVFLGPSGCGKSTLGRTILQLYHQTYGRTMYYGRSLDDLAPKYVIDTVKNLKARRTKLRELEQKRDKLEAEYAKLSEKEQYAKHGELDAARKLAEDALLDITKIVGGFLVVDDLDPVIAAYSKDYAIAHNLSSMEEKRQELQVDVDDAEYAKKTAEEAGKSGKDDQLQKAQEKLKQCDDQIAALRAQLDAGRKEIEALSSLSIASFDTMELRYYPNRADEKVGGAIRPYMADMLADLRSYAEEFDHHSESLMLFGNAGLGKTHAALAIAGIVLEKGYDVIYVSSPDFFSKLEGLHFGADPAGEEETLMQTAAGADLLILDDLGSEFNSAFLISSLYSLLNNRLGAKLPTIVTTNITDGALLEKLYTEKISSRLAAFVQIQFLGSDIRVQKAAE
mgnify:CR=1 FL=1